MTFHIGDIVKPKPEWIEEPTSNGRGLTLAVVPSGEVKNVQPYGKGQVLFVGDDPRPFVSGVFEKVEPA